MEQTDIEKCKEVFEYEMTEVLLKLQGEFSVISGKETKIKLDVIESERLGVETKPIAQVTLNCGAVHMPRAEVQVPDVHTAEMEFSKITVPQVQSGSISEWTKPDLQIEPAAVCVQKTIQPLNVGFVQKLTPYTAENIHIRVPAVPTQIRLGRKPE